jgi:P-type conjugative transfer protein TrbJ
MSRTSKEKAMLKRLGLSGLVLLALLPRPASAQLAVYDAANWGENVITAIQSVLTTIQTVLIEANQILELTTLDDIAVAGGIAADMGLLSQVVTEVQGLSYDIGALQAQIDSLFNLDTAPDTRDGLTERLAVLKATKYECYTYAAKTQTLLQTALRTVEHLVGLLDTLGSILGNMQGNQTIGQMHTVGAKHLANLDVHIAACQRAQTVDKLSEALILESVTRIQAKRMEDWPQ